MDRTSTFAGRKIQLAVSFLVIGVMLIWHIVIGAVTSVRIRDGGEASSGAYISLIVVWSIYSLIFSLLFCCVLGLAFSWNVDFIPSFVCFTLSFAGFVLWITIVIATPSCSTDSGEKYWVCDPVYVVAATFIPLILGLLGILVIFIFQKQTGSQAKYNFYPEPPSSSRYAPPLSPRSASPVTSQANLSPPREV